MSKTSKGLLIAAMLIAVNLIPHSNTPAGGFCSFFPNPTVCNPTGPDFLIFFTGDSPRCDQLGNSPNYKIVAELFNSGCSNAPPTVARAELVDSCGNVCDTRLALIGPLAPGDQATFPPFPPLSSNGCLCPVQGCRLVFDVFNNACECVENNQESFVF